MQTIKQNKNPLTLNKQEQESNSASISDSISEPTSDSIVESNSVHNMKLRFRQESEADCNLAKIFCITNQDNTDTVQHNEQRQYDRNDREHQVLARCLFVYSIFCIIEDKFQFYKKREILEQYYNQSNKAEQHIATNNDRIALVMFDGLTDHQIVDIGDCIQQLQYCIEEIEAECGRKLAQCSLADIADTMTEDTYEDEFNNIVIAKLAKRFSFLTQTQYCIAESMIAAELLDSDFEREYFFQGSLGLLRNQANAHKMFVSAKSENFVEDTIAHLERISVAEIVSNLGSTTFSFMQLDHDEELCLASLLDLEINMHNKLEIPWDISLVKQDFYNICHYFENNQQLISKHYNSAFIVIYDSFKINLIDCIEFICLAILQYGMNLQDYSTEFEQIQIPKSKASSYLKQVRDTFYKRFNQSLGESLVILGFPRNHSAFNVSLNSKNKAISRWTTECKKFLATFDEVVSYNYKTSLELEESLQQLYKVSEVDEICATKDLATKDLDAISENSSASNTKQLVIELPFSQNEFAWVQEYIQAYQKSSDENDLDFRLAKERLFLIDWPQRLEVFFKVETKQKKQSIPLSKKTTNLIQNHRNDDENFSEADLHALDLLDRKILLPEENNVVSTFFLKYFNILQENKTIFNQIRKKLAQVSIECTDFYMGLTKAITDFKALWPQFHIEAIKLDLDPINKSKECLFTEKNSEVMQFFSLMYGPLLQHLNENYPGFLDFDFYQDLNYHPLINFRLAKNQYAASQDNLQSPKKNKTNQEAFVLDFCLTFVGNDPLSLDEPSSKAKTSLDNSCKINIKWKFNQRSSDKSIGLALQQDLEYLTRYLREKFQEALDKYQNNSVQDNIKNNAPRTMLQIAKQDIASYYPLKYYVSSLNNSTETQGLSALYDTQVFYGVLQAPRFKRSIASVVGAQNDLSLNNVTCFEQGNSSFINSIDRNLDLGLQFVSAFNELVNNSSPLQENERDSKQQIMASFDKFYQSYALVLIAWYEGELSIDLIEQCVESYSELQQVICNCGASHVLQKLLNIVLSIALAYEQVNVKSNDAQNNSFNKDNNADIASIAIVCPWHVERLNAFRIKILKLSNLIKQVLTNDYVIHSVSKKNSIVEDIEHYLAPQVVPLVRNEACDTLTECSSLHGYSVYKQYEHKDQELVMTNSTLAEVDNVIHHIKFCLDRFCSFKSEINILLYQCTSLNLVEDMYTKFRQELPEFKGIKLNLFVVYNTESQKQEQISYSYYETKFKSKIESLRLNQSGNEEMFDNQFTLRIMNEDMLLDYVKSINSKNIEGFKGSDFLDNAFFDFCILFNVFINYAKLNIISLRKSDYECCSELEYSPALELYEHFCDRGLCHLLATPYHTKTMRQYLRSMAFLYDTNLREQEDQFRLPSLVLDLSRSSNNAVMSILKTAHEYSEIVISFDDILRRSHIIKASSDFAIVYNKMLADSQRSVLISSKENKPKKYLTRRLKDLFSQQDSEFFKQGNVEHLVQSIYENACQLSGSVILRACVNHNSIQELLGLVFSNYIAVSCLDQVHKLNQQNKSGYTTDLSESPLIISLMLDECASRLGLNSHDHLRADLLLLKISQHEDNFNFSFTVVESKFLSKFSDSACTHSLEQSWSSAKALANILLENRSLERQARVEAQRGNNAQANYVKSKSKQNNLKNKLFFYTLAELVAEQCAKDSNNLNRFSAQLQTKIHQGNIDCSINALSIVLTLDTNQSHAFKFAPYDVDQHQNVENYYDRMTQNELRGRIAQVCLNGKALGCLAETYCNSTSIIQNQQEQTSYLFDQKFQETCQCSSEELSNFFEFIKKI